MAKNLIKEKELAELYGSPTEEPIMQKNNSYEDAKAKALSDQNYKAYLNTAIQQYSMKNNTQKYLNNELASRGLNSQGYGTSAHVGINNHAINLYNQNLQNYNQTEQQIQSDLLDRQEQLSAEKDNQLVTFLSQAENQEAINKYMQNYGYMNKDGSYTEEWNNLDPTRKAYIQSVVDMNNNQNTSQPQVGGVLEYADDKKLIAYDKNGKIINSSKWNEEYKALTKEMTAGVIQPNTYIKFENAYNESMYLYYSADGNIYYVNKEDWEKKSGNNARVYQTSGKQTINFWSGAVDTEYNTTVK